MPKISAPIEPDRRRTSKPFRTMTIALAAARCVSVAQFSIGHVFDAIEQRSISRRKTPRCEPLEQHVGAKYVDQVLDCLYVLECSMRHFFMRAELGKHSGARKPHQVDEDYKQAAALAALAAPFRHARLSAVKLAGDAEQSGTVQGRCER